MTNAEKQIEICLIEDQPQIRSGIEFIVNSNPGFSCVAFPDAEQALEYMASARPHVVLMDINLPGLSGIECTRIISRKYPEVLIMMCTVFEDTVKIFEALKAGAKGYILKRVAGETLIEAIRDLLRGGAPMSSDIARKVVNSFREQQTKNEHYPELTKKESEILNYLAVGFGNKQIADKMFVSVNTVRTHIYHIYEKLHVTNRVEALNKIKKPS